MPGARSIRMFGIAVLGLVLIGAGAWYAKQRLDRPRRVVLITVDTMRADRLSSYGYRQSRTPGFDRLADGGVRFALAYCDIPWTTGSLASTMTGTFGPRHGVTTQRTKLPEDRTTLAEILKEHGYQTGAVLASFATDSAYQLDQGFDSYDDELDTPIFLRPGVPIEKVDMTGSSDELDDEDLKKKVANDGYRTDASVTRAAVEWVGRHRDDHFFLWVHYFGPHERFVLEKGIDHRQRVISDYDPDTRATDAEVGRFLDQLEQWDLADHTLVILHSDHGQQLREHGIFGHGHDLYEESVRIPLLMRLPGQISERRVVGQLARNVDILPTVLDYLGIDAPPALDGRSLRPMIRGDVVPDVPAYMELIDATPMKVQMVPIGDFFASSTWHGMRSGRWKYINVHLNPPCVRNPVKWGPYGFLDVNPMHPIGAQPVKDELCAKALRENLFEGDGDAYVKESIVSNRSGLHKSVVEDLASRVRQIEDERVGSELLQLDSEQERKLRSLGYLK